MKRTMVFIACLFSMVFSRDLRSVVYCDSAVNGKLFAFWSDVSTPADSSLKHSFLKNVITHAVLDSLLRSKDFYKISIRNTDSVVIKSRNYKLSDSMMIVNDTSRLLLNKIDYMSLHYRIPWYAYLLRPIGYFIMGTAGFSLYELYTVPFDKHFEWQVPVAFGALYCVSGIVTISFGDQKTIRFKYH